MSSIAFRPVIHSLLLILAISGISSAQTQPAESGNQIRMAPAEMFRILQASELVMPDAITPVKW